MDIKQRLEDHSLEIKLHGFDLPEREFTWIENAARTLRPAIERFPHKDLILSIIYHPKSNDFHVKANLRLPNRTLFTGARSERVHEAVTTCMDHLLRKVQGLKEQLTDQPQRIHQLETLMPELWSSLEFNTLDAQAAHERYDYRSFRTTLDGFQSGLMDRMGRWLQRFPEIEDQLGDGVTISDLVEDVFFHAYESFAEKPENVSMGIWLESLIDSTLQDYLDQPDTELANVEYARTMFHHEPL
jgi:ribosome-associated translation inhibitor RaiA